MVRFTVFKSSARALGAVLTASMALFAAPRSMAQQSDPVLTQYWAVPTYYNPAATGMTDFIRVHGAARLQWLGIENAPKSFLGVADAPFKLLNRRYGTGVTITQESLGLFSNLLASAQLSTRFKALKGEFGVGLQVGYYNTKFRGSEVYIPTEDDFHQSGDVAIPTQDVSGGTVDFSLGLWYTHKWFNVGISGMHLTQPTVKLQAQGSENSETHDFETTLGRAFYFMADSNIELKNTLISLQPSMMVRTDLKSFGADFTMRATYNRFVSAGLGYRWNDAVCIMLGAEFKNFFLGYAYDLPVTAIGRASSGSHELVAGYRFKLDFSAKNTHRHRSIRIM